VGYINVIAINSAIELKASIVVASIIRVAPFPDRWRRDVSRCRPAVCSRATLASFGANSPLPALVRGMHSIGKQYGFIIAQIV